MDGVAAYPSEASSTYRVVTEAKDSDDGIVILDNLLARKIDAR